MATGTPPEEFVRPAERGDLAELVRLEGEYRTAVAGVTRGGPEWLHENPILGPEGWARTLADPLCRTLVAGLDAVPLGYGAMRLSAATSTAVITTVYVDPGARELGLGDALVGQLLAAARGANLQAVEATALPGDRDTKNLFERAGLVARLIVVRKRLV